MTQSALSKTHPHMFSIFPQPGKYYRDKDLISRIPSSNRFLIHQAMLREYSIQYLFCHNRMYSADKRDNYRDKKILKNKPPIPVFQKMVLT